jgi:tryptophan synthase alpha chain
MESINAMKNRITELFERKNKNILSVFYTAGFPKLHDTISVAALLEKSGADIIEIGIPFSDPIADGPTIQQSNKIALSNGMNIKLLLDQVKTIRQKVTIPIILMGYLNPVMQYGVEQFVRDAAKAGVDGLILPDLPLDVYEVQYQKIFKGENIFISFLISPTTSEERIKRIDKVSSGFIYAVSSSSTTGAKRDFSQEQISYFEKLKTMKTKNPYLVGFGISNHSTFAKASTYCSGAIVGSAFINLLESSSDLESDISTFIQSIKHCAT